MLTDCAVAGIADGQVNLEDCAGAARLTSGKSATGWDGVAGVDAQLEQHLVQLRGGDQNRREVSRPVPSPYVFADGHHEGGPRALCWGGKDTPPEAVAGALVQAHGALLSKPLLPNLSEREWLYTMVAQRTAGQSYKAIALWLNANGSRTKLGRRWQCGSVASVLGSRHTVRLVTESAAAAETGK